MEIVSVSEPIDKQPKLKYQSTKVFDGFSTCFRQWRSQGSHCHFLHGYSVSFKVWFEGELDHHCWVWDFGGMKKARTQIDGMNPKAWMEYMFDHTVIVAEDDPYLPSFYQLQEQGVIQLRVLQAVSAEKFAELVLTKLNEFVQTETAGRVRVKRVEFREHERNSAVVESN
ncbi:6-carboxytetrahydropterin synthase [Roseofilum reptotaenium CS-1145]|uniref:6-carboxy-5,6,7,8-tetrahydropterin synthase n=1 Tax=Roseofilum reptotaenium AO1-A TaxID=1925591 RepID=A0A1L9QUH6_9CYAN|nr:6-carboxytetrahydropterin synthase [Roseofilum reptotaenium]MDB9517738.1 6-carboxytetrahydropterin synthase [Roseofilum reptotaenium CS-1145]OJJ26314.1 hypothetical protein BI308_06790 [Roseofilum reptotaenium AO1-A]